MNYSKEELISKLGIGALDDDIQEQVLGTFLQTLETRTGQAITEALSNDQLDELDKIVTTQGDEAGENWLHQMVPNFDDIEQQQCDALIAEVNETGSNGQ